MTALLALAVAVLLCGLVVFLGAGFAESLIPMLSETQQQSLPLLETLFSLVIFGSLLLFALIGGKVSGVNPLRLGDRPARMAGIGLLLGGFGLGAAATYAAINGTLAQGPGLPREAIVLAWGLGIVLFQTASEEIYFRGWLQPVLARHWGRPAAILTGAAAFAALHVMGGARSPTTLLNIFLGGLLFGLLASHGRGIAGAVAAHFAWNASEQLLLGLDPNPGIGSFGALFDFELAGAAAWGGSAEGLNASVAMTFALCAMIAPVLIMAGGRQGAPGTQGSLSAAAAS